MASNFTPQQIEEFLQEFFDVVGARQYIGARYVPIFGRAGEDTVEWDDTAPYEPLTVVMRQGVSYVSRRYVPAGIAITDTGYWVETYRFNAQVEQYRQEVLGFQDQIDEIREDYVPFPDPDNYPKYGTAGQVLSTLADGTTRWEDPVVPSDEQAETVITAWLADHPEATTTVQDGSITDVKINANASIVRSRGTNPYTDLNDARVSGFWAVTNASSGGTANSPEGRDGCVLSYSPRDNVCDQLFISFSAGNVATLYYRHYYGSAWSQWVRLMGEADISTLVNTRISERSMAMRGTNPVSDLNNATDSGYYAITNATSGGTSHTPENKDGSLLVWAPREDLIGQVYLQYDQGETQFYNRELVGTTWTTWRRLTTHQNVTALLDQRAIIVRGTNPYADLNDAIVSGYWAVTNASSGRTINTPEGRDGSVLSYTPRDNICVQLYMQFRANNAELFYRQYYGTTWSQWYRIPTTADLEARILESEMSSYGVLNAFTNIVCCGDSLTRGVVNLQAGSWAYVKKSYPTILGEITGATVTTIAQGGYTASDWWNNYNEQITQRTNCLAIIYLGTNGGLTDTVDTDCPVNVSMENWATTNTGNYGRIIQSWKNVGAKVLLINVYDYMAEETLDAVRHLADRFGCGLVDDNERLPAVYRAYINGGGSDSLHYNGLGYAKFTNMLCAKVATMPDTYLANIMPTDVDPA